jgi:hypothetical protein
MWLSQGMQYDTSQNSSIVMFKPFKQSQEYAGLKQVEALCGVRLQKPKISIFA